jgi:hypothetical protein
VTYSWKALDKGYNFVLNLIRIGGLHSMLWALKITGVLVAGLPFGSPKTKFHSDVGLVERHKV